MRDLKKKVAELKQIAKSISNRRPPSRMARSLTKKAKRELTKARRREGKAEAKE